MTLSATASSPAIACSLPISGSLAGSGSRVAPPTINEPGIERALFDKPGKAADHRIDSLARHDAAELKDERRYRHQTEHPSGGRFVDRVNFAGIETAGDNAYLRAVGFVIRYHVRPVLGTFRDNAVAFPDNNVFNREAFVGKLISLALVDSADAAERVKGYHKGYVQQPFYIDGNQARHPEVRMDDVVNFF